MPTAICGCEAMKDNPLRAMWRTMHQRCSSPAHVSYPHYGGRGIKVCERWRDFENFAADMGERPPGYTIDRIDPGGDYEPSNCRWISGAEQQRNRTNNRLIEYGGRTLTLAEWADELGVKPSTLHWRVKRWPLERAMSAPVNGDPDECRRGHPLTEGNLYVKRNGSRQCRECQRKAYRDFYARAKAKRA